MDDLVIMTRRDFDVATDEQMQTESESALCAFQIWDTPLNNTELFSSEEKHLFRRSLAGLLTVDPCRIERQEKKRKSQQKDDAYQSWDLDSLSEPSGSPRCIGVVYNG